MSEAREWVRFCAAADAPADGELLQAEAASRTICLANVDGTLRAVDNVCPHRQGPLAEGWIENGELVCPWHGWSFNPETGVCTNASGAVEAYPVKLQGPDVLVGIRRL
ncbi:MAG TPA: Rieske (2Fe-2S) protein [Acidobacteriaceae bacterium]|nr:Rieske (2Fe-2S) protein [Acidobacteriaceae bacterium]